jgi:DNA-binding MarR family transcriptional regulator
MHVQILSTQILPAAGIIGAVSTRVETDIAELWRSVLDVHARVSSALERALQDEHGLGVSEFEVLDRLANIEQEGCRMHDLSATVHLSQSALSRDIGRLEKDGFVTRAMCKDDRRGIYAILTDEGRERWRAAQPTHRKVLAATMGPETA